MNAPHEAWLAARRTGIGGSDVAPILGLSKWTTPLQVYMEKRGELQPQPDNPSMRWGRYLEPVVRQAYADETGLEVRVVPDMLRHSAHDFLIANLDGFVAPSDAPRRVFEAKTARTAEGWGEPGTDQIPQPYLLQVQHYMAVTGFVAADVAVLIGGSDFRIYEVHEDRELQAMVIDACADFWARVQAGEPPEPISYADAKARFGRASVQAEVVADSDVMQAIAELRDLKVQQGHLEHAREQWQAVVMRAMGEADTLVDAQGRQLATWKAAAAPRRFDAATFKAHHPDLYGQFVAVGEPSRRFLLR